MLQFVDSFECLRSRENNTMVVHLMQREPSIDTSDGKTRSVITLTNKIASIVMEPKTALDLCKTIAQLYQMPENAKEDAGEEAVS